MRLSNLPEYGVKLTRRQCLLTFGAAISANAATALPEQWRKIAASADGVVGTAALHLGSGQLFSLHGDDRFPLMSVCKLPIAMNMLALVDEGKFALNQEIEILPRDVVSSVSPLSARWPAQRRFALEEMIRVMVAQSDNTAVETLFRMGGEGEAMADRFRQWTVDGVRVDRGERQCGLDRYGVEHYPPPSEWTDRGMNELIAAVPPAAKYRAVKRSFSDSRDTGTPNGTVQLLARLFQGDALSKSSTALLIGILKETTTGPARIKGLLPAGTVVAHKTGSSGTIQGFTTATNDSGVIFLPKGGLLAVSVYLKASTRNDAARDSVIARISRAAFEYFA
jgi:beta-lactamase class A